jgi:hypothetical protein
VLKPMPMQTAEVALTCERANIDGVQTTEADTDGNFERIHRDPLRCGGKCFSTLALARPSVESRFVEAQARYMGPLSEWSIYIGKDGLSMRGNEALCYHASRISRANLRATITTLVKVQFYRFVDF